MKEIVVPSRPSNRHIIQHLVIWGWEIGPINNRAQTMIGAPFGATNGVTLTVKPATSHNANPQSVFQEIYRLTTHGNAETFWRGPPDPVFWADTIRQARVRAKKRKEDEQNAEIARLASRAARRAERLGTPIDVHVTSRKEKEVTEAKIHRLINVDPNRVEVRSQQVYDVLAASGEAPITVKAVGTALGLDMTKPENVKMIATRCGYLVNKDLAVRHMTGIYRVKNWQPKAVAPTPVVETKPEMPVVITGPAEAAEQVKVVKVAESIDDTIEAVLDLLLPDGFRAADLKAISEWVTVTKQLVNQVAR